MCGCGTTEKAPDGATSESGKSGKTEAESKTPAAPASGTLVVYNCNTDDCTAPIVKEFQEQTGIKVELVGGGSGELMARVKAEAGNPLGDVMWGGTTYAYAGLAEFLEPYESTEKSAINPNFIAKGAGYVL